MMAETRSKHLQRVKILSTFLCPDGHSISDVPPECHFGHRRAPDGNGLTETDNLKIFPSEICQVHITKGYCLKGTVVRCDSGLHPTLRDFEDLEGYIRRAHPLELPLQCANRELSSVTCSFAQLQVESPVSGGPINRLPNELLELVLARLKMKELIPLEVVCTRWQKAIFSIGRTKKSFHVYVFDFGDEKCEYMRPFNINQLRRFFAPIKLHTFTSISWKVCSHLQTQFIKRFPNMTVLSLELFFRDLLKVLPQLPSQTLTTLSVTQTGGEADRAEEDDFTRLLKMINRFVSLKQLSIEVHSSDDTRFSMASLAPTLARLEKFSYSWANVSSIVPHLSPNCTRVCLAGFFAGFRVEPTAFYQWHTVNGQWLASVTHLELERVDRTDTAIEFLSKHAVSLRALRLLAKLSSKLTPLVVRHLARLPHLAELELDRCLFVPQELNAVRKELHHLISVETFTLEIVQFENKRATPMSLTECDQLAFVLSTICPNVQHLNICVFNGLVEVSLKDLEHFLFRFPKLLSHCFDATD